MKGKFVILNILVKDISLRIKYLNKELKMRT